MWDAQARTLLLSPAIYRCGIFFYILVNANTHFVDGQNLDSTLTWLGFHHPTI